VVMSCGRLFLSAAAALAACGEPIQAAMVALRALDIARASGSGRVLSMIIPVSGKLTPHSQIQEVTRLRDALARTEAV
jgi:hypothetical protein